mmetsp:Transcript_36733/g.93900  ORF Transcript_36733/g.93900 Transcript_36733/m.93900 type:complete len:342 (-) Transcript_36733:44-1069(-)
MAAPAAQLPRLACQPRPHRRLLRGSPGPCRPTRWRSDVGASSMREVDGTRDPLALPEDLPLSGRRVMITAPRQYAAKLAGRLIDAGAQPVWTPAVTITALDDAAAIATLDALLANLEDYTHIAFVSTNSFHSVLSRLSLMHGGPQEAAAAIVWSGARCCALGADAEELRRNGVPCHVQPAEASTMGLARELEGRGEAAGARVLCPVPSVEGYLTEPRVVPAFLAALEEAGADAVRANAYLSRHGLGAQDAAAEREMLERGRIDAIAFSSTAEAQGLAHAMGGATAVRSAVEQHGVVLAAHGRYTAAGAGEVLGMPVECVSRDSSTFAGLVHALEDHFRGCM